MSYSRKTMTFSYPREDGETVTIIASVNDVTGQPMMALNCWRCGADATNMAVYCDVCLSDLLDPIVWWQRAYLQDLAAMEFSDKHSSDCRCPKCQPEEPPKAEGVMAMTPQVKAWLIDHLYGKHVESYALDFDSLNDAKTAVAKEEIGETLEARIPEEFDRNGYATLTGVYRVYVTPELFEECWAEAVKVYQTK